MPLTKYANSPSFNLKLECQSCPLYDTKTEDLGERICDAIESEEITVSSVLHSGNIVSSIDSGFSLSSIKESGATFYYPESLSTWEWIALDCYSSGRNKAENEENEKEVI